MTDWNSNDEKDLFDDFMDYHIANDEEGDNNENHSSFSSLSDSPKTEIDAAAAAKENTDETDVPDKHAAKTCMGLSFLFFSGGMFLSMLGGHPFTIGLCVFMGVLFGIAILFIIRQ